MTKREIESDMSQPSKKARETIAEKLQCVFPVPEWLINEDGKGRIAFITYGRYQPAHIGHKAVFDKLVNMSRLDKDESGHSTSNWMSIDGRRASNVFVFASPTVDKPRTVTNTTRKRVTAAKPGRYPIPPELKTKLMEEQTALYENPSINVINMAAPKNQAYGRRDPAAAVKLILACYEQVVMLVGSDRVNDFAWIAANPRVTVKSAGQRDEGAEGVMGMSGTKLRSAVMSGDFESAKQGMKYGAVTDNTLDTIIETLRSALTNRGGKNTRRTQKRVTRRKKINRKRRTRNKRIQN